MAWITPVYNRTGYSDRLTHTDMNRICGNINYLLGTTISTSWNSYDLVTKTEWDKVVSNTNTMASALGRPSVSRNFVWYNLNEIERIADLYYNR